MKITKLKFRLSASDRHKCGYCGSQIDGKEGFVEIIAKERGVYGFHPSKFCLKCLNNLLIKKEEIIKNIDKIYPKLVKRIIIRRLK